MRTFEELLKEGTALLMAAGIEEARLDAWLLLEYTAGISRAWYYAHPEKEVSPEAAEQYQKLCRRRAEHIPLQHLTHQAFFMGYEFYVDERVLIPRQDTEILAEEALCLLKGQKSPAVLDLCTGSGCLLLSLLMEKPDARGTGTDISADALEVAKKNAERLGLTERACLVQSDLFSAEYFRKNSSGQGPEYDMLISNPPYIPSGEISGLMEEVRLHDPYGALDGGADGLDFYRRITREARNYLKPGAWILYETGSDQGQDVSEILAQNGFEEISVKKDLSGLDRVALGRMPDSGVTMQEEQNV